MAIASGQNNVTYTDFDLQNDVVFLARRKVAFGMWQGNQSVMNDFYAYRQLTDSTWKQYGSSVSEGVMVTDFGTFSGNEDTFYNNIYGSKYYLDVYSELVPTDTDPYINAEPAFSISYGSYTGRGSSVADMSTSSYDFDQPTKSIYQSIKNLVSPTTVNTIQFPTGIGTAVHTISNFYAIVINKNRMREMIDPGNWELVLNTFHLIDVTITKQLGVVNHTAQYSIGQDTNDPYYFICNGTLAGGPAEVDGSGNGTPTYLGVIFPKRGLILLNHDALIAKSLTTTVGALPATNAYAFQPGVLFDALSQHGSSSYFSARAADTIISTNYFVRIKNKMYNRTYNPSIIDANGILNNQFMKDPKTFITTVGLYGGNDGFKLVAVAKLNKPILKAVDTEALIQIRLDF